MTASTLLHFATPALLALAVACGGTSMTNTGGNGGGTESMSMASPSGDAQQANPNSTLPNPFRVIITKAGSPVSGKTVTWTVTTGGGSVSPTTSTTGTDGTASTVATIAAMDLMVSASADGVSGSPVTFGATIIGLSADVTVRNNSFTPQTVAVKLGGTVHFTWNTDARGHNVTPDDGKPIPASPGLPALNDGPFTFSATFTATGDYYYHCANHGSTRGGMFGKIVVVP